MVQKSRLKKQTMGLKRADRFSARLNGGRFEFRPGGTLHLARGVGCCSASELLTGRNYSCGFQEPDLTAACRLLGEDESCLSIDLTVHTFCLRAMASCPRGRTGRRQLPIILPSGEDLGIPVCHFRGVW